MSKTESRRIWEIDFLRGLAVILMVIYHIIYDLNVFACMAVDYLNGFWYWEGRVSALLFIFLSGVSSGFSRNSAARALKISVLAMAITLVTYIFYRSQYVRFGILHLLAVGIILFPLFQRMNNALLFGGAVIIALAALPLNRVLVNTSLLLPFGVMHPGFASFDYCPLSPYLSVFILGVIAYKLYYCRQNSLFKFKYENKFLLMLSKNSLAIYLIHQPAIIAFFYLLSFLKNVL